MQRPLPQLTRRDTWIPRIPDKTSLLWQQVGDRLAAGAERAWLPLVSFEDERLLAQSPGVELRALQQALQEPIGAATQARVISLDRHQPTGEWPEAVSWSSALEWLLQA